MEKCDHCPFRADAGTRCAAQVTRHVRLCTLVDPAAPGHRPAMVEAVRRLTLEPLGRYTPPPPPPPTAAPAPAFPPLARQAANLAGAVGRFVASGGATTTAEERGRRLAICRSNACGQFVGGRCARCGCLLMAKVAGAAEHCPLDPPLW